VCSSDLLEDKVLTLQLLDILLLVAVVVIIIMDLIHQLVMVDLGEVVGEILLFVVIILHKEQEP
jgi:hypothetical protein